MTDQIQLLLPTFFAWITAGLTVFFFTNRIYLYNFAISILFFSGILTILYLMADGITGQGINYAVISHLLFGLEGLNGVGFWEFRHLIIPGFTGVVLLCGISYGLWRHAKRIQQVKTTHAKPLFIERTLTSVLAHFLLLYSITAHPAVMETFHLLFDYRSYQEIDPNFKRHLYSVRLPQVAPQQRKNIVYLYAESLERTYFDEQRFAGLIRELRTLEHQSLSFTQLKQAELTGWTVAGMTASQCGIPLSTFTRGNHQSKHEQFEPGMACIGNILNKKGYHLTYIGGAKLSFAGKERFYREHGFTKVQGLNELLMHLPDDEPQSSWGLYDDRLLDLVFDRFQTLSASSQPFGLFSLTLDTHPPFGHETPACKGIKYLDGSNPMLNAVACADLLISKFVRRILDSPYGENTLVIVASDHLAMNNSASDALQQGAPESRNNLFMVFNSGVPAAKIDRPGTTLDIAPTLMSLAGFPMESFALGRNLLGQEPTLLEQLGFETLNRQISHWRLNLPNTAKGTPVVKTEDG